MRACVHACVYGYVMKDVMTLSSSSREYLFWINQCEVDVRWVSRWMDGWMDGYESREMCAIDYMRRFFDD